MSDEFELTGVIVQITNDAILWGIDGEEYWFPRKLIDFGGAEEPPLAIDDTHDFSVPLWIARDRGLDPDDLDV